MKRKGRGKRRAREGWAYFQVDDLSPEECAELLQNTALDIVMAGDPEDSVALHAAHGADHSFVLLSFAGQVTAWRIGGGTKEQRKKHADGVREGIAAKFGIAPDSPWQPKDSAS